jgi:hypothetical protein
MRPLKALICALVLLAAGRASAQSGLVVHEWGVWKLRLGQVEHLEELAAESPRFVNRSAVAPALAMAPDDQPFRVSLKPVVFFYADRPMDVNVHVRFRGGRPWLYHPNGREAGGTLTWDVQLEPAQPGVISPIPEGHWWQHLRDVGADVLMTPDGGTEHFLFYDGPVRFARTFRVDERRGTLRARPSAGEDTLWIVEGQGFREMEADPRGNLSELRRGDVDQLRTILIQQMEQRDLSHAEAVSMVSTWAGEFFNATYPRALYFVARPHYDRMLPIRITPPPDQLVRVGMVIEELP